ncbi:DUF4229 domain-containing protein [Mycobacterium sp. E787]|uniref:DUF4229 domain-containing protein n=1 Tax=Mycobacterium sp. E787 TaxID=1834150 RepID=UPI000801DE37|nr:DUF4229 domain-containing protein [Mycobacterium sp. E787]OBI51074.1 hypothetical protein A5705_09655 [Mycobacterium sp. E787]
MSEGPGDNSTGEPARRRVLVDVLLYAAARLVLLAALGAAIYGVARLLGVTQFPLVVAVLFALILAMPLGIWLFAPLRRRATAGLAIAGERRRREREQLQARLRGEAAPDRQEPEEPDE